jgi:hypothetical protein
MYLLLLCSSKMTMKTKNELLKEIKHLKELMREAVLDDYFVQKEPDFEKKWNEAINDKHGSIY